MWTETLLGRLCQLSDQSEGSSGLIGASDALQTFRAFAKFSEGAGSSAGMHSVDSARSRRLAWKSYYDTLSTIIRLDLSYDAGTAQATSEKPATTSQTSLRLQQRAELKRVETIYESLLIKETHFPKASEGNREIEIWVDSVIDNWRLLCGASWTDSELGEGGKEGVGRSVIDVSLRLLDTFYTRICTDCVRFYTEQQPRPITPPRSYVICSLYTHPWPSLTWPSRPTTHISRS